MRNLCWARSQEAWNIACREAADAFKNKLDDESGLIGIWHAMSRGFAAIGAPFGITSNVLAPGLIMTKLVSERLTQEALDRAKATIPLGRGESPEEVALAGINMIRSSFITGEVLNINGGSFMLP